MDRKQEARVEGPTGGMVVLVVYAYKSKARRQYPWGSSVPSAAHPAEAVSRGAGVLGHLVHRDQQVGVGA